MIVELEVPAITNYKGIVCNDSGPNWAFDSLINELNHIDKELQSTSPYPLELKLGSFSSSSPPLPPLSPSLSKKSEHFRDGSEEDGRRNVAGPFVMRIPFEDSDDESEEEIMESTGLQLVTTGTRFSCADLDFSEYEASDDESVFETICDSLMRKTSLEEGLLYELERENQLKVKDSVRKRVSKLEDEMREEYEKTAETLLQIEKHAKLKCEIDQRLDNQYQQKIADERDYHLSVVQRNHERRSQEEELRIRKDAAIQDAKRREKALEEKIRQEKEKAEVEARLQAVRKAEEARKAAFDAAAQASKEEADKQSRTCIPSANENKTLTEQDEGSVGVTMKHGIPPDVDSDRHKNAGSAGLKVKAADSAIKAEASRLQKYNEIIGHISQLSTDFIKEYDNFARQINKRIRQISGTAESVRAKANDILSIINDRRCPSSISIVLFAKKVVSLCDNPSGTFDGMAFACGHVILLVNSQVPAQMDFILAEFHKVCIYTVPKYIQAVESAARTNDYWKMMGYHEENGKLETSEKYLQRIEACMKLYAALVQEFRLILQGKASYSKQDFSLAEKLGLQATSLGTHVELLTWRKLAQDYIKLNCDGAANGSPMQGGGGGILRDSKRQFIAAYSQFCGRCEARTAEILALQDGLRLARKLDIPTSRLIGNGCSRSAKESRGTTTSTNWKEIMSFTNQIKEIRHQFHEVNSFADGLAQLGIALQTNIRYYTLSDFPQRLRKILVLKRNETETQGVQNPLGLKEGWAWMARFLNEIPATASSATALHAFLKMAGFSLLRKYKIQFKKLLNIISSSFLPALKAQQNPNLAPIISKLEIYISKQEFLKEPEGWRLRTDLSSRMFV